MDINEAKVFSYVHAGIDRHGQKSNGLISADIPKATVAIRMTILVVLGSRLLAFQVEQEREEAAFRAPPLILLAFSYLQLSSFLSLELYLLGVLLITNRRWIINLICWINPSRLYNQRLLLIASRCVPVY